MFAEPLFLLDPADERVLALGLADPRLAMLIGLIGELTITGRRDPFQSLVRALIGQQLSVKAAATICSRAEAVCGGQLTPSAPSRRRRCAPRAYPSPKLPISGRLPKRCITMYLTQRRFVRCPMSRSSPH
ncbi:hypothetical protein ACFFK0_07600 [Paenibacillus chartarius]|uniref:Uncharacterized protein n=1 Tax=Paenibacillus chartarius TaxID=747481 RepID=A0ABV6DI67_9BACL